MLVLLLAVVFAVLAVYCFGGGFACVLFWMTACDGWLLQFGGVLVNSCSLCLDAVCFGFGLIGLVGLYLWLLWCFMVVCAV